MGEIGDQKNNGTRIPLHQIDTAKKDERNVRNGAIMNHRVGTFREREI
jgi:hypothetical protein